LPVFFYILPAFLAFAVYIISLPPGLTQYKVLMLLTALDAFVTYRQNHYSTLRLPIQPSLPPLLPPPWLAAWCDLVNVFGMWFYSATFLNLTAYVTFMTWYSSER
jgi:hypothetical protein